MGMRSLVLLAHNLRSCHNVGSLLRTADGLGVSRVYLTGYTPYPISPNDERLPHLAAKVHKQIQKTALGSEKTIKWEFKEDVGEALHELRQQGFSIVALEQHRSSINLLDWRPPAKVALVVGRETLGIEDSVLKACDVLVEIPMLGSKESFNVTQAAAMGLFYARFTK